MGITKTGHKEILGFYSSQSQGAHFWLTVLNDLKNRGVKDILIASVDGFQGFPEAINTIPNRSTALYSVPNQELFKVCSKQRPERVYGRFEGGI